MMRPTARTRESAVPGWSGDGALSAAVRSEESLEGVLDLLAGLLQVAGGLVFLALGLQVAVVGRVADGLLALAGELLCLVLHLVDAAHRKDLLWSAEAVPVPARGAT